MIEALLVAGWAWTVAAWAWRENTAAKHASAERAQLLDRIQAPDAARTNAFTNALPPLPPDPGFDPPVVEFDADLAIDDYMRS